MVSRLSLGSGDKKIPAVNAGGKAKKPNLNAHTRPDSARQKATKKMFCLFTVRT